MLRNGPVKIIDNREFYPLSNAQKRLLIVHEFEGSKISYNVVHAYMLEGKLDVERFENAFRKVIERHEALRTAFIRTEDEYVQKVYDQVDFSFQRIHCTMDEIKDVVHNFGSVIDLSKAPLVQAGIAKLEEDKYLFLINIDHIISDTTSFTIFINEVVAIYEGRELPLPQLQYKDFTMWQIEYSKTNSYKKQEQFWLEQFGNQEIPILDLTTDYPRSSNREMRGDKLKYEIDAEICRGVKKLAIEFKATIFMVYLAAYNILLQKYTGQEDIVVGTVIAKRNYRELQNVMGALINQLALRNYPSSDKKFSDFLSELKVNTLKSYMNSDYPYDDLVTNLKLGGMEGSNALISTILEFQNHEDRVHEMGELKISSLEYFEKGAPCDIEMDIVQSHGSLNVVLTYEASLFKRETMERMVKHYFNILKQIVENPDLRIRDIDMLSEEEKEMIFSQFNNTKCELPEYKTIVGLFEHQVFLRPDANAVIYGEERLTYQELSQKVNQVAGYLIDSCKIESEDIVGIAMDRSIHMLVSIMGVLKAGGAYVPIDVEYPIKRIQTMINDSKMKVVITESKYDALLHETHIGCSGLDTYICIDQIQDLDQYGGNIEDRSKPDGLAYIIYTSGSTGNPKGAMLEHIGMVNHLCAKIHELEITENSVIAQSASHCFDISVWQFLCVLAVGGTTVIYPKMQVLNISIYIRQLIEDKVSILEVVPSYFTQMMEIMADEKIALEQLKYIVVTGEELKYEMIKQWLMRFPNTPILNAYGPTETSDDITHCIFREVPTETRVPIGKPIQNANIYIVDNDMNLCPVNVRGEIVVSGCPVGRGYLNNPQKTKEVFKTDPFQTGETCRLYKTGDIGRWLPDGTIEFFGRKDHQVKIRGFRIELGEIERTVLSHESVSEVIVIPRENQSYICAYIVCIKDVGISELKAYLSERLPEYMVPSYIVKLDKMPVTSNGKINRKELPEPEKEVSGSQEYQAPRNELEQKIASILETVLKVERVGVYDDFFEIGGDSLKAILILMKVSELGIRVEPSDFFKNPTLDFLSSKGTSLENVIDEEQVEGKITMLPVQKWFFEQNYTDAHFYNRSYVVYRKDGFDLEMVKVIFTKIFEHHDGLRMIFPVIDGQRTAVIKSHKNFVPDIHVVEQKDSSIEEELEYLNQSIDLEQGPLLKLGIINAEQGSYLCIAVHRLIADPVSIQIIIQDVVLAMKNYLDKKSFAFPEKTTSYMKWGEALKEFEQRKEIQEQLPYWKKIVNETVPSIFVKSDIPKHNRSLDKKMLVRYSLQEDETIQFSKMANSLTEVEVMDILLTTLYISLNKWSGLEQFMLYIGGNGRNSFINDMNVTRTTGWFNIQYPFYLSFNRNSSVLDIIKEINQKRKEIPMQGIGYGMLRYLGDHSELIFEREPEINFNYIGVSNKLLFTDYDGLFQVPIGVKGEPISKRLERAFPLDVICGVREGCMSIDINFSEGEFSKECIMDLGMVYVDTLRSVIVDNTEIK